MTRRDLSYRSDGPSAAPTVLLGPALGTCTELWEPQLVPLARRYRVVRFDTRGHGGSPAPLGPYDVEQLTDDVLALADRLGLHRFAYVGLSLGGAIGQVLALKAPERLASLVLSCTAARFGDPEPWRERAARVSAEGMGWLVEPCRARWFTGAASGAEAAHADRLLARLAVLSPTGYAACCEAIAGFDARHRLPEIAADTLVLAGEKDVATPAELTDELAANIPRAEHLVLDGAAHLANVERPAQFSEAVLAHLRRSSW